MHGGVVPIDWEGVIERKRQIGARLYERRAEGIVVPFAERILLEWRPVEHQCHFNVDWWVINTRGGKAVRGWLFFDFKSSSGELVKHVVFQAHSVIEENGVLLDITPSQASRRYPFIRHDGSEDEFVEAVEDLGASRIDYMPP